MAHIFLYGPPGSGKSTLGKMLAQSLRLQFVDLDQAIQRKTGMPIPKIMEERGEKGFRDMESSVLSEQPDEPEMVIALGGGTLLRAEDRALAEKNGTIVCLRATPEVLLQRLCDGSDERPLLSGDVEKKLTSLLGARGDHYRSFGKQFDTDGPPELLIPQLQTAIGRFHLSAMGSYDVIIEHGGLNRLGSMLRGRWITHPIVVTDENVSRLHSAAILDSLRGAGYNPKVLAIPAGEGSKTFQTISQLWHGFLEAGLDRQSTVIALGGGVVGDLAGFAASTFMRGIVWICVPTTLLSMVDASLGGKTGFDLPEGKNLIGSFHAPGLVLADPGLLSTLPEAEFRAGLAEVVKHGVVADPELFDLCAQGPTAVRQSLSEIVRRAVAVKAKIIEADPYEKGERAALNLGHTVGHAVESVSGFTIRHGEAVAMGLVAEAKLAERLAIAAHGLADQMARTLSRLDLPVHIPPRLSRAELIRAMHTDKKQADGVVRFALPAEIGRVQINIQVRDLQFALGED